MSNFRCSNTVPCRGDLCCSVDGYCSSSANACDKAAGCLNGCSKIPNPHQCTGRVTVAADVFPSTRSNTTGTVPLMVASKLNYKNSTACGASGTDYALQPCDLVDLMGGAVACPYCLYYYDAIREAVEAYDLATLDPCTKRGAPRLAAFLAQLRHETAALATLFQPADGGAGGIHMIPLHFAAAVAQIPRLRDAVRTEPVYRDLTQADWDSMATNATMQRLIGNLIQRPEHAFLAAGWWFTRAAAERLDPKCGDLRRAADDGLGVKINETAGTGYYEVSRCIFGSLNDAGLAQRVSYYQSARALTDQYSPSYVRVPPTPDATGYTLTPASVAGIVVAAVMVLAVVGYAGARYRKARRERMARLAFLAASRVKDSKTSGLHLITQRTGILTMQDRIAEA
ncbi:hypothetical protein H9P43_000133 [Blastocladiella emersonii ATCC 22665]|nr:hypothetical protein H9P43_000133 [Blastocladiella emersonii ATCC 22665]